jgi:hypothetical protein
MWEVTFSDGSSLKFRCAKTEANDKANELAEEKGLEVKRVIPVLYPKNPLRTPRPGRKGIRVGHGYF